ncbi:hypothetical protein VOLCADRAFT_101399 [Volvox carteri f. nagariensis]|uniref:Uncharacterized protein n=1 Tax=Volvox carteri f. nagariensis TaxID=3068 RepID=D8UMJ6_VOLCA|nr:uncharacterized protein VOLCADRAFT_101399 [Volvox carteri f. nagariensis]EFJ39053.1 hypothetical protein VOLCADRAFT_101399 [Volvox carteri f. nagariensis]|eukprot:XP_002959882.1 hypothetical protein VOLCADRAFT_101399 [Volvox carteri f. nagariensis]
MYPNMMSCTAIMQKAARRRRLNRHSHRWSRNNRFCDTQITIILHSQRSHRRQHRKLYILFSGREISSAIGWQASEDRADVQPGMEQASEVLHVLHVQQASEGGADVQPGMELVREK